MLIRDERMPGWRHHGPENCIVIYFIEGYWREHKVSSDIFPCVNKPENCEGGSENFTCAEGTIGVLCETCDIYGER
jgi:hypothetical protein